MQPSPPPLPRGLADPRPVIVGGTAAFLVAAVVLLVTNAPDTWMWTGVAGGVLGLIGLLVVQLQRGAARRGSRSAQRGLP